MGTENLFDRGSGQPEVTLENQSAKEVKIKAKTIIGKIAAANVVPLMLTPNTISTEWNVQKEPQGTKKHEEAGMAKSMMLNTTQAVAITSKGHDDT